VSDQTNNFAAPESRYCCDSTIAEIHADDCMSLGAQFERAQRDSAEPLSVSYYNTPRHPCCLTQASGVHRFNCPVGGLAAPSVRVERADDCCARKEGEPHTDECTSNEAVLSRVDLESARLEKMSKAVEYRMQHGNPLDHLKRMVDAGEMTAAKEIVNGGTFIRFTSTRAPDLTTRYGPLRPEDAALAAPVEIVGKDYSHKPRVRIPVRGLPASSKQLRRSTVKAAIGRKLIALGRYLTGD
jgi:hypothetical protein